MSERTYSDLDDEQILSLVDEIAEGSLQDLQESAVGPDGSADALRRTYVEALALLPYELEVVSPAPDLRSRILGEAIDSGPPKPERRPGKESERLAPSTWFMPLAAALLLALVGISGWQIWRVEEQAETIARLSMELERAQAATAELAAARELVAETRTRLEMMMASTAEYCALKPTKSCPNQQARGTLVMQRGKSDWFLRVEGLGPCEKGRQYKLWFVTESEPVLGASFAVEGSHDLVEIRATGAPAGIKAVMITLEEPEVEAAPETPVLLYGDERMRIL